MTDRYNNFDMDDDDIDLDLDLDMSDDDDDDDAVIPKRRVATIIQKRLAREKNKLEKLHSDFKNVYGMSPDEAVAFGITEQRAATTGQGRPQVQGDPVLSKISELDQRWQQMETSRAMEREAAEFVQTFPNVKFDQIPKEVLERRALGGVTIAEAYRLATADQTTRNAARRAAESVTRGIKSRDSLRVEGADYTGSGDVSGALTEDERTFARMYGMSPKEYTIYKQKLNKMREDGGAI